MIISGNFVVEAVLGLRGFLLAASPEFSRTAGMMLLTAIWQGTIVAACLTICLKLTNRISASLRFMIWSAGFLAVVGLPFLPLLTHLGAGTVSQPAFDLGADAASGSGPWLQLDVRWSVVLTVVWLAASLYRLADLAVHSVRLRRLWKTATPVELGADFSCSVAMALSPRGRKRLEICTTNALDRPSVIGFFAPRILIPAWLFDQLTPGELEQIVLHETEHLRRGDDWTNLLQKLSLVVFPLNPVLLWIERQLCLEREMACDEAVVRVTRAPRAYAACLTSLAERGVQRRAEALSLGAWQRRPELVHRVHSILRRKKVLGPLGARSIVTLIACGIIFGTVELSRCPQLIAFTQTSEGDATQSHALAAQEIPVRMPFRMVDTRFTEPPPVQPSVPKANKPYSKEFKPSRSGVPGSSCRTSSRCERAEASSSAGKLSLESTPSSLLPRQQLLKTQGTEQASVAAQEPQEQSWIVLTTWEEVATPNQGAVQSDTAADQPGAHATDSVREKPAEQLKVTQLVFKVIPANSKSQSPLAVPIRGGWLVIQL
jgi:beta-lactamase regulating signal transducer with metallopeptidase domain